MTFVERVKGHEKIRQDGTDYSGGNGRDADRGIVNFKKKEGE